MTNEASSNSPIELYYLVAALILLQILDGLFTGIGVTIYGPAIEANILLRTLMESFGHVQALVLVKSFAIAVIFGLAAFSAHVSWIPRAMKALIAIYLVFAIIPWGIIFTRETVGHYFL